MVKFKGRKISIVLDDPDECHEFLRGLILAQQNNNSPYFPQLIAGVNAVMEPYTMALIAEEKAQRGGAPSNVIAEDDEDDDE